MLSCLTVDIEVVSRDRGGEYAAAVRKGAPQAQQVADKFHLLPNLREKLKELMARKQKLLPHVETPSSDGVPAKAHGVLLECSPSPALSAEKPPKSFRTMLARPRAVSSDSAASSPEETPSQISRSNHSARYEAVRTLHQQMFSQREIARRLKMSHRTVRRFLVAATFPERRIVAVSLILTNPTFSNAGSRGAGMELSSIMRSGCVDTADRPHCFAASLASSASSIRVQEQLRS